MIFPELTYYLQMSPCRVYFFFALVKWNIYHTYRCHWQVSVPS